MFDLPAIKSPENSRIKAVAKLRRQRLRRRTGLFTAEGLRQVCRGMQAGLTFQEGFVCPELVREVDKPAVRSLLASTTSSEITCFEGPPAAFAGATGRPRKGVTRWFCVPESLMRRIAYRQNPQGILAVFEQPNWDLNKIEDRVTRAAAQDSPPAPELWLVTVGTSKPGNLGAMVRSAAAAGATGVLVADAVVDPFNANAVRASTCAVFSMPVVVDASMPILTFLERRNVRIVTANPGAQTCYTQINLRGPLAFVVGSEHEGLPPIWTEATGAEPARIPMAGKVVDSLNASTSAAVLLFEVVRQRQERCGRV